MDRVTTLSAVRHADRRLAIGVDVGGTWLRLVATRDGAPVASVVTRSDRDLRRLPAILAAVWRRRGWRRARVGALVVASRAIWTGRERRALARRLAGLARRVRVVPDAQAALLGALGDRPGVLVLAGTGSIVLGWDGHGRWARAGGLGPLVGDEGSAFWLGREWLRVRAARGGLGTVLGAVHDPDAVARIAARAPRVLARARRGDPAARRIARAAQEALAAQARDVARTLALRPPVNASWAGSVLDDAWFRAGLARAVARAGLRARWHRPAAAPVAAALRLARRMTAEA
jgi:N-acetylglucosamine kinase-like BadF-type ATPase